MCNTICNTPNYRAPPQLETAIADVGPEDVKSLLPLLPAFRKRNRFKLGMVGPLADSLDQVITRVAPAIPPAYYWSIYLQFGNQDTS